MAKRKKKIKKNIAVYSTYSQEDTWGRAKTGENSGDCIIPVMKNLDPGKFIHFLS